MAVAYRSNATATKAGGAGTNLVINVPAGTANGDVMVAFVLTGTAVTPAVQASWTTLDSQNTGPTVISFYRIASSEPASYTFTVDSTNTSWGTIVTYSGTHATTPINKHAAFNRLTSTTNITGTTITPDVNNCMILWLGAAGTATSITKPASYTDRVSNVTSSGTDIAELLQTSAAATGSITGTGSTSTNTDGSLIALAPAAGGSPPVNTVAPAVTGTTTVGQVLSSTTGTWTTSNPVYTYQWQRDAFGNSSYSNIGSATSSTYTLVDADDGCNIRCNVTDTDDNGATTQASNVVGLVVEAAVPAISVAPAVTGTTTVGQTLTTDHGTWTGMGGHTATYAYQWQRDVQGSGSYSNISSATSTTYVLVDADDACHIKCLVTATNDVGAGSAAASNIVGTVIEPNPTNSVVPALGGVNATSYSTITSTTGTWANMGGFNPTYTYQWKDSATSGGAYSNIVGATSSSYVVAVAEETKFLKCFVTANNTGTPATANTVASNAVAAGTPPPSSSAASVSSAAPFLIITSGAY